MKIRLAQEKDIPRLLDLLHQVLEVHAAIRPDLFASGQTKYDEAQLKAILSDGEKPIYVAVLDGQVVGYAFCQLRDSKEAFFPVKAFHLDDFCVDQSYRQQGIGQALFDFVKEEARKRGCYEITLNAWPGNEPAQRFYQKQGLQPRSIIMELILEGKR